MAGHSKWANIKHKKAKLDKIKGKVLSRCAREIIVAAKNPLIQGYQGLPKEPTRAPGALLA